VCAGVLAGELSLMAALSGLLLLLSILILLAQDESCLSSSWTPYPKSHAIKPRKMRYLFAERLQCRFGQRFSFLLAAIP